MAYCADTDIFLVYGEGNTRKWADADNDRDEDKIAARIAWAIAKADAYIDDRLRRKWHDLPFSPVPTTIKELSAQLAGVILFRSPRGLVDGEDSNATMTEMREECDIIISNILGGVIKLDYTVTLASHPESISE